MTRSRSDIRTTVYVGLSVDGCIARTDGAIDWLPSDGGEDTGFHEFFAGVDVLVMGRKTFETALGFGAWPYGNKKVVVLSRGKPNLAKAKGANVEHMSGEPNQILDALAKRGHKHAYIDGGATVQGFLQAGLVNRLVLTYVPVLIGEGIRLFGNLSKDVKLETLSAKSLKGGLLQVEYTVEGSR